MSITVHQSPTGYKSAHEEVWHVVESTNKAVAGFQYVFDIYKSGSLVTRVKNTPFGIDKYGVVDLGNIVRATLDTDYIPHNLDVFSFDNAEELGADQFWTQYDVRYGEVSGGVLTENISSGTYKVYNNYNRSVYDRKQSVITGPMILSNRPTDSYFYEGEPVVMSVFLTSGQIYARQEKIGVAITAPDDITGNNNAYVFGYLPTANDTTFQLSGSVSGVIGTRNFKKKCAKYDTHTLVFLNAFGAFDSFTFVYGKYLMDNEKKKFEQLKWSLSGTSMVDKSGYVYNESMKAYATKYSQKMQLTSDIMSTGEYDWLAELINSPLVYLLDSTSQEFYPVMITDTNYEFKDDRINKTDTLTVNIEFSDSQNTQYR